MIVLHILEELNQELSNSNPDRSARTGKKRSQSGKPRVRMAANDRAPP